MLLVVNDERFSKYEDWNKAICDQYMAGRHRSQPLYLDMDEDALARVARKAVGHVPNPRTAFISAVKQTLNLRLGTAKVFQSHVDRLAQWEQTDRSEHPPFVGLLAFFTLIAESMINDERFKATNYYGRLAEALQVGSDKQIKNKVDRHFRSQSHIFWNALNKTLIDSGERIGIPTAFAFDSRVHVGIPISQALIREGDRQRFPDLFTHYRLAPGSFAVDEMVDLLKDWIPQPGVSSSLRHLWQSSQDVRERIAAIACHELESWDGLTTHTDTLGPRRVPIRLVASVGLHPRPKLDLDLRIRIAGSGLNRTLRLRGDAGHAARLALEECGASVTLVESVLEGWGEFHESDRISVPDVLIANITLRDHAGQIELERRAKQVVVFKFDPEQHWFVEAERASLAARHTLLVHHYIEQDVLEFVQQYARPGWKRFDTDSMASCPEGWTLVHGVSLLTAPESAPDDLQPLVPISSAAIAFSGGLALPERRGWHAAHPPEVSFSVETSKPISAILHPLYLELAKQNGDVPLGQFTQSGAVRLRGRDVPPGEYRVAVYELGKAGKRSRRPVASSSLRLRSAETARPPDLNESLQRSFNEDSVWAAISAVDGRAESPDPIVAGGLVELECEPTGVGPLPPVTLKPANYDDEFEAAPVRATRARSGSTPACFDGSGSHHWIFEEPGKADENRRRLACCKHCGLEQWHNTKPARHKRSHHAQVVSENQPPPLQTPRVVVEAIEEDSQADLNTVFDAISLLREGTWNSFVALARQTDDQPWFASELARKMEGLGHIEMKLDPSTLQVVRWVVGPPVLVALPGASVILAGFRSRRLLNRIQADVESLGGSLRLERLAGAPSRVRLRGIEHQDLSLIAASASDALGFKVHAVKNAASRLLSGLPHISELVDTLPQWQLPLDDIEKFEIVSGRWVRTEQSLNPGAYRTRVFPRTYAFVPSDPGMARIGNPHLVKHLEAVRSGVPLMAYKPRRRELLVRLGAQLPGLYERVAMLCSGGPPRRFKDGTQRYKDVSPEIAAGLWSRLGHNGAPS